VDALLHDFFAGYYGAAAGPIREYFDKLQTLALSAGMPVRIFDALRGKWLTMEFVQQAERLWAQAEKLAEGDRDLSYRVRMAGIPVLWAKLKLLGGPERIYQVEDGRLVHRQVDPAYRKAGRELLRRVAEGHVRVREYTGYHQQEIMDLTGHVEGHKLVEASAGGATVATAPGCGGSAVVWSQQGKSNLLSPAGGGVEIVNRHRNLERPDFTEFELVSNESGRIALRAARPRAVWGPQTRERVGIERELIVNGEALTVQQTFSLVRQTQEIVPAVRVALPLGSPVTLTAGEYSANLTLNAGQTEAVLELPGSALQQDKFVIDVAGSAVRLALPADRAERMFLRLDRTLDAAVFAAVYPTTKIGPDTPRSLRVRLSRAG